MCKFEISCCNVIPKHASARICIVLSIDQVSNISDEI